MWRPYIVFVVERNYWGLGTPEHQQFIFESFERRTRVWNEGISFNANDLAEARAFFTGETMQTKPSQSCSRRTPLNTRHEEPVAQILPERKIEAQEKKADGHYVLRLSNGAGRSG